jgi:hypothetical protein
MPARFETLRYHSAADSGRARYSIKRRKPYNRLMKSKVTSRKNSHGDSRNDSAVHELECARQVVSILFDKTGLSTLVGEPPTVVVGAGNWISFTAQRPVSSDAVFGLAASSGALTFVPDLIDRRGKARSRTSPSLHLTNLDSEETLRGHVDAHYWAKDPLAHAGEYLRKKTAVPSDLLRRAARL